MPRPASRPGFWLNLDRDQASALCGLLQCGFTRREGSARSVAKVIEITAESSEGFEDAIRQGIERAERSIQNVKGAWVAEQKVHVQNGAIVGYRVDLKVTFVLNE